MTDAAAVADDKVSLERLQLELTVEKLRLEAEALRRQQSQSISTLISSLLPAISTFLAVGAFAFSLYQQRVNEQHWREDAKKADEIRQAENQRLSEEVKRADELRRAETKRLAEERNLEIRRQAAVPFWERQLELYLLASEQAGILATSDDPAALKKANLTFRELYWGRLASVEDVGLSQTERAVEAAMVQFQRALDDKQDRAKLQPLALQLARRVRDSIQPSFNLEIGAPNAPSMSK